MSSEITKRVGRNIARARRAQGLSQSALARQLGVESMTISRWERGENAPRDEAMRVALAELLTGGDVGAFYVDGQRETT